MIDDLGDLKMQVKLIILLLIVIAGILEEKSIY